VKEENQITSEDRKARFPRNKQHKRKATMKTTNKTLIATVASIALFAFASPMQAQYKTAGDDGIAASPRARQMLNERKASSTASSIVVTMSCPKCKNVWDLRRNTEAKGAQALISGAAATKATASHLCAGCQNKWEVVGQGKAKQSMAMHSCTGCGAKDAACCSNDTGTKKM
jgi:hypothetical protein